MEKNTFSELSIFSELSHISSDTLRSDVSYSGYLPEFCSTELDFLSEYKFRLNNIHKEGYGIFAEYNELQKAQSLDLSPYCGKRVRKVLLKVTNHPSGDALAALFLYRDCVVGGSLSSGSPGGFVCGFEGKNES